MDAFCYLQLFFLFWPDDTHKILIIGICFFYFFLFALSKLSLALVHVFSTFFFFLINRNTGSVWDASSRLWDGSMIWSPKIKRRPVPPAFPRLCCCPVRLGFEVRTDRLGPMTSLNIEKLPRKWAKGIDRKHLVQIGCSKSAWRANHIKAARHHYWLHCTMSRHFGVQSIQSLFFMDYAYINQAERS